MAAQQVFASTVGLRSPPCLEIREDDEGITLVHARVLRHDVAPVEVATAAGRFATAGLGPWGSEALASSDAQAAGAAARNQFDERLRMVARGGGWTALLAHGGFADVIRVWARRETIRAAVAAAPRSLCHGDLTPDNVVGISHGHVLAVDWAQSGVAARGTDLGYHAAAAGVAVDALLPAYVHGAEFGGVTCEIAQVKDVACAVAVFTVATRTDRVLAAGCAPELERRHLAALAGRADEVSWLLRRF